MGFFSKLFGKSESIPVLPRTVSNIPSPEPSKDDETIRQEYIAAYKRKTEEAAQDVIHLLRSQMLIIY